jgi:hypothetical protein
LEISVQINYALINAVQRASSCTLVKQSPCYCYVAKVLPRTLLNAICLMGREGTLFIIARRTLLYARRDPTNMYRTSKVARERWAVRLYPSACRSPFTTNNMVIRVLYHRSFLPSATRSRSELDLWVGLPFPGSSVSPRHLEVLTCSAPMVLI